MPYISADRVKEIRNQLKKEFPAVKFSVTKYHGSGVNIDILAAPFQFEIHKSGYTSISLYDIRRQYSGEQQSFLSRIYQIANEGNRIVNTGGDYGTEYSFYVNISLGTWEKHYQCTESKIETKTV